MSDLRKAAEAVLDRWDSPAWEWTKQGPTAELMATLRAALAAPEPEKQTVPKTVPLSRIKCGFVDVQFDGERWFCEMCGERMNEHYEEMVKHSNGKDYLELMQRKAAFKIGRDKT